MLANGTTLPLTLTYDQLVTLRQPIVYIWSRGNTVLYVGMSNEGIARPITRSHEKIGQFQPGDTLTIHAAPDAKGTEEALIRQLRPRLYATGPCRLRCPVCRLPKRIQGEAYCSRCAQSQPSRSRCQPVTPSAAS